MKSIREELLKIKQSNIEDASLLIAKELLKNYDENIFLSLRELAIICHISEGTVTYFSKKIGYSGYRELVSRMKSEKDFYNIDSPISVGDGVVHLNDFANDLFNSIQFINNQKDEFIKIVSEIKNANNIFIFSSYEQMHNAESFYNILGIQGYKVWFSNYRKSGGHYINDISEMDLAIFIVSGLDNLSLIQYYERIKNKNVTAILISSNSQEHKFIMPFAKIVVKNTNKNEIYLTAKNIYFNYIFNLILINL